MGARSRSRRAAAERPDGQHLLRSAIATELVRDAGVRAHDLVLEIGAGDGRLTEPLARRARLVLAIELDPVFVARLTERFDTDPRVEIVHGDAVAVPLPSEPFRVFGNIPFGETNAILRRLLDDPGGSLVRADLVVQWEVARKRCQPWPSTALGLGWSPWWELSLTRRIPRAAFTPSPSVDGAVLRIDRRASPVLEAHQRRGYLRLVREGFERPTWPVPRALHGTVSPLAWKRFARERGLATDASPRHLDVWDWVALFRLVERSGAITARGGATRAMPPPRSTRGSRRRR